MADKYTADEVKALGAKGEAFKNADGSFSYPVADEDDLKKAIKAVGRGNADHDAIRKYLIGRAKALGASDLIPDNWNADGSLSDAKKAAPAGWSKRAAGMTYNDAASAVQAAISEKLPNSSDDSEYVYVVDMTDTWVVYEIGWDGEYLQASYQIGDDGTVTVGDGVPVQRVTTYKPLEQNGEGRAAPTEQDSKVSAALVAIQHAVGAAMEAQKADPDHGTDPDDAKVWAHLEDIKATLTQAMADQAADGSDDQPEQKSARIPATVRRGVFSDLREREQPVPAGIQVRLGEGDSPSAHFSGVASTTGVGYDVSDWLGSYRETINPGAFAKTLRETAYVPLLLDHDGLPMASTTGGNLILAESARGLDTDADLDRRQGFTNDVVIALERGDLSKMSFSFRAVKQSWSKDYTDRQVSELQLFDVSVVKNPANPTTSAGLRSELAEAIGREGRSTLVALRSALTGNAGGVEDDLERALRVLRAADDHLVARSELAYAGRGRLFVVGSLLVEARAGKVLSADNQTLVANALAALGEANDHLGDLAAAAGMAPDDDVDAAATASNDGTVNDDGSVPRSAGLTVSLATARATALRLARARTAA